MAEIKDFKGIHRGGDRVFITASGPSLKFVDEEKLRNEYIITVNDTIIKFPWASYSNILDKRPFKEHRHKCNTLFHIRKVPLLDHEVFIKKKGQDDWSWDLNDGIYVGCTTSYTALQIAVYMGFEKIYFLGLDLRKPDRETSHFHTDKYRFERETGQFFPRMTQSMKRAANMLEGTKHKVINISRYTMLDCFPIETDLEKIL